MEIPSATPQHTLENTIWGDLLTSVTKGSTTHTLFYDGMGNPINYGNGDKLYTNLTWENGRELTSLTTGDITYTYAYDAEGIRTSKTVNGVTHTYITQNGKVVRETIGTGATAKVLDFIYDNSGRPFALRYSTNGGSSFTTYYYVLNLQGDVVRMVDASGTIAATYRYNAWGKLYSQAGTMAIMNPLRYRGYYYDTETGFYYLQSRYYDPANCRFINADCYTDTGTGFLGFNMFAYCGNNPVNRIDPTGEAWWHWALGAVVVAACAVATVVTCGGFAAAATAVGMVGSGVAATTTTATVTAATFIGSATVYGMAVVDAATNSKSVQEFYNQGNWWTVAAPALCATFYGGNAYLCSRNAHASQPAGDANNTYNLGGVKNEAYISKRGWTDATINEAIANGPQGSSINMATNAPCTVYTYPGMQNQYVVIENTSRNLVQASNFADPNWIPDSRIVWFK